MAKTKSQLPMIRSLKTIARRKANIHWHLIDIPEEVQKKFADRAAYNIKTFNRGYRILLRQAGKTGLLAVALERSSVPLLPAEKTALEAIEEQVLQLENDVGHRNVYEMQRQYQNEALANAKRLFADLERLELSIISGEEVDLAPYARQLQS